MKKFYYILTVTSLVLFIGCGGGGGGDTSSSNEAQTATVVEALDNDDALNPPSLPGVSNIPVDEIVNN